MKKNLSIYWIFITVLFFAGCSDSSNPVKTPRKPTTQASEKRQFVWNAMNYWYYWQPNVPKLSDNHSYFNSDGDFQDYLSRFANADSLFQDLRYQPQQTDFFSFFIDDYEAYNDRNQGIYAALGFEYGYIQIANNKVIGYVQYIVDGSPADEAGLKRGDIFTRVDGTQLNVNNFSTFLRDSQSAHMLTLATINGNTIQESDSTVTVEARQITEDPVFSSTVIDTANKKIGYLVYNAFQSNSHRELNEVFGMFKEQQIDDFILDLRYNGGGSVLTSQVLSSMISGRGSSDEFAEFTFSDKRSANNDTLYFLNNVPIANDKGEFDTQGGKYTNTIPINTLSVDRVYVIVGIGTASASEALINALKPYMDVVLIGTQTVGKDEGSITLYDAPSPYTNKDEANPDIKIALQPIVLKITNKNHNPYANGFKPGYQVRETNFIGNLPSLGSQDDPLTRKAISLITGQGTAVQSRANVPSMLQNTRIIKDSRDLRFLGKSMYVEPGMLKHAH